MKQWWFILMYVVLVSFLVYKLTEALTEKPSVSENFRSGEVFEVSDRYWF